MKYLQDIDLSGKRLLLRADLNVPVLDGKIIDDTRIVSSMPSILYCLEHLKDGARLIITSHFGRPPSDPSTMSEADKKKFSLAPLAAELTARIAADFKTASQDYQDYQVKFAANLKDAADAIKHQPVVLLENTRFLAGETKNDDDLAKQLADLCDVFVMDAFGSAHRAHASTCGITKFVQESCGGILLAKEIEALNKALKNPARPVLAILGGAKIGDKLKLLDSLSKFADSLILGGGIANTFLAAQGSRLGKSLYEEAFIPEATKIMDSLKILLPQDVVVASSIESEMSRVCHLDDLQQNEMILDAGSKSLASYKDAINKAGTIIWNGPLGVFEKSQFAKGTSALVAAICDSSAYSLAGGGETIAAINKFCANEASQGIDYISTGGGAFLEYVEQGSLPAIDALSV